LEGKHGVIMAGNVGINSANNSLESSINPIPDHVLIVDDDQETLTLLSAHLKDQAQRVTTVDCGSEALKVVRRDPPDLILLDLMMPKVDGFQVCKSVRANYQMPIIVISALGQDKEKVKALDLGADDYLEKPYSSQELKARIRAVMRRSSRQDSRKLVTIKIKGFLVDINSGDVSYQGEPIQLTPTEFNLLVELLSHPDQSIRHEWLLKRVWGSAYTRNVEYLHMYVSRLRKKLEGVKEFRIQNCPGIGYKLVIEGE
jgi:DNA-binding response OmpR family regulator